MLLHPYLVKHELKFLLPLQHTCQICSRSTPSSAKQVFMGSRCLSSMWIHWFWLCPLISSAKHIFGFVVDCWSCINPPLLFALHSFPGFCSHSSWCWLHLLIFLQFAGIQRAHLPPSLFCLAVNSFLHHPSFGFGQPWLIRHASSGHQTIIFLLLCQQPYAVLLLCLTFGLPLWATTKGWPHAQVPFNHLVVNLARGKWQDPITHAPQFFDAHVSHNNSQAFLSQIQRRPTTFVFFASARSCILHFTLHNWQSVEGQLYSIQYKGIFGIPDDGQTLYVWQGQTFESGLRCWAQHLIGIWGVRTTTSSPHHPCIPM